MSYRRWLVFVGGLLWACACSADSSVTLSWDPSSDPLVVGYRVYWGTTSHDYSNMIDVGDATSATVTGLSQGTLYFFAVTDYEATGLESAFSGEIPYTPPITGGSLQLTLGPGSQLILSGTALAGYGYEVQATDSLSNSGSANWTVIGIVTADLNNSFQFIDPLGATNGSRFYRLHQL